MISSEVQRTLVKSPPELWSELSDPAALARHLGELGEIKITKLEPEQSVEWEAEAAKGKVILKPSGWGTKVTLTMEREMAASAEGEAEGEGEGIAEADAAREADDAVDGVSGETSSAMSDVSKDVSDEVSEDASDLVEDDVDTTTESAEDSAAGLEATTAPEEQAPRPSFFARLFKRRSKGERAAEAHAARDIGDATAAELSRAEAAAEHELDMPANGVSGATAEDALDATANGVSGAAAEHELDTTANGVSGASADAEPSVDAGASADAEDETAMEPDKSRDADAPDLAAELAAAEEAIAAQTTEMLTAILDRLGAAHHRPFSRA